MLLLLLSILLDITYHPAYACIKDVLTRIHIILASAKEHENVFSRVPTVGFKRGKSLGDMLVRAKLPDITENPGNPGSWKCGSSRCEVCRYVCETNTFSDMAKNNTYKINGANNCNSKCVVYLAQCKRCKKQYVGSCKTAFRTRFNNYKSAHRRYLLGGHVKQQSFQDWQFSLIDECGKSGICKV